MLAALLLAALTDGPLVAVLELRQAAGVDAHHLTNLVRAAALAADPRLLVITRENIELLSRANLADCESDCEVETGRRLGADFVVSGDIVLVNEAPAIDLRLHETRSARLLATAVAHPPLEERVPEAVRELLAVLLFHAAVRLPPGDSAITRALATELTAALVQSDVKVLLSYGEPAAYDAAIDVDAFALDERVHHVRRYLDVLAGATLTLRDLRNGAVLASVRGSSHSSQLARAGGAGDALHELAREIVAQWMTSLRAQRSLELLQGRSQ